MSDIYPRLVQLTEACVLHMTSGYTYQTFLVVAKLLDELRNDVRLAGAAAEPAAWMWTETDGIGGSPTTHFAESKPYWGRDAVPLYLHPTADTILAAVEKERDECAKTCDRVRRLGCECADDIRSRGRG